MGAQSWNFLRVTLLAPRIFELAPRFAQNFCRPDVWYNYLWPYVIYVLSLAKIAKYMNFLIGFG